MGSKTLCTSYKAAWDEFDFHPNLTRNFITAVASLEGIDTYYEFVNAFGTHYPTAMLMGGSSFYYSTFSSSALSSLVDTYGAVGVQAAGK